MRFYLGTHKPAWLARVDVPLFVSHRTLADRRTLPAARVAWALDSGGFTELDKFGRWVTTADAYVEAVARYQAEIGRLEWAAPMDWVCTPNVLEATGLTVHEHQRRTVENYLELRERGPFIPVLQGWTLADFVRCVELYAAAGVDLVDEPVVGVGSVAARQHASEVGTIFRTLWGLGIRCHGFGVKRAGLRAYGTYLASADSMAWSYAARRDPPLAGCTHRSCSNCQHYALRWRRDVLNDLGWSPLFMEAA